MDTFEVFDEYRGKFLVGEMIWNFADFETDQCELLTVSISGGWSEI